MKKFLVNKTFDEFWIDCQMKNYLTILTHFDSDFLIESSMNDYVYEIVGQSGWYRATNVLLLDKYLSFANNIEEHKFKLSAENIVEKLISFVDECRFISINVDLYDWNENSVLWHNKHNDHFSLLIGYDLQKKIFYFDEDKSGDSFFSVSFEKLLKSLNHDSEMNVELIEYSLKKSICKRKIEIYEIIENAKRIVSNIDVLKYTTYWGIFENHEDMDILCTSSDIIYNRQLANKVLINYLYLNEKIESSSYEYSCDLLNALLNKFCIAKNMLIKNQKKLKLNDFERINKIFEEALNVEKEFWVFIIKCLVDYNNINVNKFNVSHVNKYDFFMNDNSVNFIPQIKLPKIDNFFLLKKIICTLDCNGKYYTDIILDFYNYKEKYLYIKNNYYFTVSIKGKVVDNKNYICEVLYNTDNIVLKTQVPFTDILGLDKFNLICGIRDSGKEVLPQIIPLFPYKNISPYINKCYISLPYKFNGHSIDEVCLPLVSEKFKFKYFTDYFCSFLLNKTNENQVIYFKYIFECNNTCKIKLFIGHTGGVKIWCNKSLALMLNPKETPAELNDVEFTCICNFQKGYNEIIIAAQTNFGNASRIKLRIANITENNFELPIYIGETAENVFLSI